MNTMKVKQATKTFKRKFLLKRNRNNFICGAEIIKESLGLQRCHAPSLKNRMNELAAMRQILNCFRSKNRKYFKIYRRAKITEQLNWF